MAVGDTLSCVPIFKSSTSPRHFPNLKTPKKRVRGVILEVSLSINQKTPGNKN